MAQGGAHIPPFRLERPEVLGSAAIFASPHSGSHYPESLLLRSPLDAVRLRSSEDAFVDRLLQAAPGAGAALIAAQYPRAWVDLNRAEDELDPAVIAGLARGHTGPRVAAGLGVIPRVVSGGRPIYAGKIPQAEAEARLAHVWRPYHVALDALMTEACDRFGRAILLDMHSMPSEALEGLGSRRPEVVLGDRYGASAAREIVDRIEDILSVEGFRVARNSPFAGAYTATRYGRPRSGHHVIQIEIDRALYMDECTIRPAAGYDAFAARMDRVVRQIAALGARPERLAAE